MVGCIIVAGGEIIGEGWHRYYGQGHAEVQAVQNVKERGNRAFLFHFGSQNKKTLDWICFGCRKW